MVRTMDHASDCLKERYIDLDGDDREYWPRFLGRDDLCTCSVNPNAAAKQPANAEARAELQEHIEACERRYRTERREAAGQLAKKAWNRH